MNEVARSPGGRKSIRDTAIIRRGNDDAEGTDCSLRDELPALHGVCQAKAPLSGLPW